jgi:hypothetical protein
MSDNGRNPDATNADRERRRFLHCAAVISDSAAVFDGRAFGAAGSGALIRSFPPSRGLSLRSWSRDGVNDRRARTWW